MIPSSPLVQLGRGTVVTSAWQDVKIGPIADKFFFAGVISGFLGMSYFGVHMWLMLHGQMNVSPHYALFRQLHLDLQIFGFLGLFVLGFANQAAGKMLEVQEKTPIRLTLLIPLMWLGIVLRIFPAFFAIGTLLIAACFWLAMLRLTRLYRQRQLVRIERWYARVWLTIGLLFFSLAPFLTLHPTVAVLLLWHVMTPIVVVSIEQFVVGFLDGQRYTVNIWRLLSIAYLLSLAIGLDTLRDEAIPTLHWRVWSCLALVIYIVLIRALFTKASIAKLSEPLGFGIGCSLIWAITAATIALLTGSDKADYVLHTFAIGFLVTLILTISQHVLSYISMQQLFSRRSLFTILLLWQIVPIGRCLVPLLSVPLFYPVGTKQVSIIVSVAASIVLTWHMCRVSLAEWQILRRAFAAKKRL